MGAEGDSDSATRALGQFVQNLLIGKVFRFLGVWMEQSYISLAFGDFYHPVPPPTLLWSPS